MNYELLDRVVLYGAGAQNARVAYQTLGYAGYTPMLICDKDVSKHGQTLFRAKIYPPEKLKEIDGERKEYIIIITPQTESTILSVKSHIANMKLQNATVFTYEEFAAQAKLPTKMKRLSLVIQHLVDDCNLNCIRCNQFSPLAKKGGFRLDEKEFELDCQKLSDLTSGDIDEFQLFGGEPMMHPNISVFPYIVKRWFPKVQLTMLTNGTYIKSAGEAFWQSCRDCDLKLLVTAYPIGLDYKSLKDFLIRKGIDAEFGNTGNTLEGASSKKMWGIPLTLNPEFEPRESFEQCLCVNVIMREGRLYPCCTGAYIDIFNAHFSLDLPSKMKNSVDIRNATSIESVTKQLSQPIPLCAYCDSKNRMPEIEWAVSKKELGEWTLAKNN
jgi:hypothetical protein